MDNTQLSTSPTVDQRSAVANLPSVLPDDFPGRIQAQDNVRLPRDLSSAMELFLMDKSISMTEEQFKELANLSKSKILAFDGVHVVLMKIGSIHALVPLTKKLSPAPELEQLWRQAAGLISEGVSVREIALKMGVSDYSVRKHLKNHSALLGESSEVASGGTPQDAWDATLRFHRQGKSEKEISALMGTSLYQQRAWIKIAESRERNIDNVDPISRLTRPCISRLFHLFSKDFAKTHWYRLETGELDFALVEESFTNGEIYKSALGPAQIREVHGWLQHELQRLQNMNGLKSKSPKCDISYRAVDDMFTSFYPENEAGQTAWKILNEHPESVAGKVLTQDVGSVITQLRAAGYTVSETAVPSHSDDDLLSELQEVESPRA